MNINAMTTVLEFIWICIEQAHTESGCQKAHRSIPKAIECVTQAHMDQAYDIISEQEMTYVPEEDTDMIPDPRLSISLRPIHSFNPETQTITVLAVDPTVLAYTTPDELVTQVSMMLNRNPDISGYAGLMGNKIFFATRQKIVTFGKGRINTLEEEKPKVTLKMAYVYGRTGVAFTTGQFWTQAMEDDSPSGVKALAKTRLERKGSACGILIQLFDSSWVYVNREKSSRLLFEPQITTRK